MKIQDYSFGKIVIDGKTYTSDVIVYPERLDTSWWRKQGHLLQTEDIAEVLDAEPEVLIIGTGYSGGMQILRQTLDLLESKGIEVHVALTRDAVSLYQKLQRERNVIAALHLTC